MSSTGLLAIAWGFVVLIGARTIATRPSPEPVSPPLDRMPRLGRRARRRLADQLAELVEETAHGLRSGSGLLPALAEAGARAGAPVAADVATVVRWVQRGATLADATHRWADQRAEVPAVRLVVAALTLAAGTGGRAATALDGVAATLRERLELTADIAVHASQARASAWVMGALPLAFVAVGSLADPSVATDLVATPLGRACLVAGLVLEGLAVWWMRRILAGAAPW